jgi:hypothetical protein
MDRAILKTGIVQPEAIEFYEKSGYRRIENYGPYVNDLDSICMRKVQPKTR